MTEPLAEQTLCLVIPYFGPLPNYFKLWLESCRQNPSVQWLLLVDRQERIGTPPNVTLMPSSLEETKARLQNVFDFPITLERPYKLCDYKPAYGEAFKSELAGFDYWGFCDLDTIWGDLRKSLRAPLHGTYDRIFGGGHLSIFRNSSEVNEAYRQGGHADGTLNYRDVFTSSRSYAFDEWGLNQNGLNRIFEQKYSFYLDTMPYADVKPAHYALRTNREGFTLDPGQAERERRKRHIAYTYSGGRLHQHAIDSASGKLVTQEEAYIHLQKRPMHVSSTLEMSDGFAIIPPNKFEPLPRFVDDAYLRKHAPEKGFYAHYYTLRYRNLLSKARRLLLER